MTGDAKSVVILTGAGISKESGLSTFRDPDGIWAKYRIEDVATPQAFAANPELVHSFYNTRRAALKDATLEPNIAHQALADFEQSWPGSFLLVTQNVDNLHQRASSQNLIAMHGSLSNAQCQSCGHVAPWAEDLTIETPCPNCSQTGGMRPDVVWFGEMPRQMDAIENALATCDVFAAIGTSATVYPAAGFVDLANRVGAHTIEVNLEPSSASRLFDEQIIGPATEAVPKLVQTLRSAL